MDDHQFTWILWYIWKGKNNKVFINLDIVPRETLKFAETESTLWAEAQVLTTPKDTQHVEVINLPSILRRWCFTDGSWKDNNFFSRKGWYSILEGFDGLMGARNVHASLSRYSGQWSVWEICVTFGSHLQRIFLNWWRWFRN